MAETALLEAGSEKAQDALCRFEKTRKLLNAGFAAAIPRRAKDYVAGVAYLRWKYAIHELGGDRYEATFLACRTENAPEGGAPLYLERDGYVHRIFDGDDKPVLVGQVELVHSEKGAIRSTIWLHLTHQIGGELTSARSNNILLQPDYEVRLSLADGEVGVFLVTVIGDRAGGNQVIERGPKIVDGIANHQGESWRGRSPSDHIAIATRNLIELGPGGIDFAFEELVGGRLEFLDMGFCPIKL